MAAEISTSPPPESDISETILDRKRVATNDDLSSSTSDSGKKLKKRDRAIEEMLKDFEMKFYTCTLDMDLFDRTTLAEILESCTLDYDIPRESLGCPVMGGPGGLIWSSSDEEDDTTSSDEDDDEEDGDGDDDSDGSCLTSELESDLPELDTMMLDEKLRGDISHDSS